MRVLEYIREPRRLSLFWRAVLANAAVLALAFVLLHRHAGHRARPDPAHRGAGSRRGLATMLAVNLLLAPARARAAARARSADGTRSTSAIRARASGRQPEAYRRSSSPSPAPSTRCSIASPRSDERGAAPRSIAQERERLRIARALHDEAGQTLTAIALEIERAATDGPRANASGWRRSRVSSIRASTTSAGYPRASTRGARRPGAGQRPDRSDLTRGTARVRRDRAAVLDRVAASLHGARARDLPRGPGSADQRPSPCASLRCVVCA